MIARIEGQLESVANGIALLRLSPAGQGGFTYEVLLPAFTSSRLTSKIGQHVQLFTFHFLESQGQGSNMLPRLAGFLNTNDLGFFQLFTTCKGIGFRKALRAMTLDTGQIAAAVADRDAALLQTLPEVGKRTAETIIASLRGKVDPYISAAAYNASTGSESKAMSLPRGLGPMAAEALEALLQLGENRIQAMNWIDTAMNDPDNPPRDVSDLIARVYHIKSGG